MLKAHGLKFSNLYISQVKRKCGIEVGENYNLPKSEDSRQPQCPVEKEKAIKDALEHFGNGIISVSRMNMKTNKREDRVWSCWLCPSFNGA